MHNCLKTGAMIVVLVCTLKMAGQNVPANPCQNLAALSLVNARALLRSNAETESYSSNIECVAAAIDRLGEHQDPQDIPLLISYLAFSRPVKPQNPDLPTMHPTAPDYGYPAIAALAQQGEAAREPLLSQIGEETDSLKRHNAAYALIRMNALTPEIVITHLKQKHLAAEPDAAARYEDAIAFAKTTWPCKKLPTDCEKASSDK